MIQNLNSNKTNQEALKYVRHRNEHPPPPWKTLQQGEDLSLRNRKEMQMSETGRWMSDCKSYVSSVDPRKTLRRFRLSSDRRETRATRSPLDRGEPGRRTDHANTKRGSAALTLIGETDKHTEGGDGDIITCRLGRKERDGERRGWKWKMWARNPNPSESLGDDTSSQANLKVITAVVPLAKSL